MKTAFCGLCYIDIEKPSAVNLPRRSPEQQVNIYINNALLLARSLHYTGERFILFTNNAAVVADRLKTSQVPDNMEIIEIPFHTRIGQNLPFYAAHMRQDMFLYQAGMDVDYLVNVDLDMVALREMPGNFKTLMKHNIPACYDITDQMYAEYGMDYLVKYLGLLKGTASAGRWYGGEFISGSPAFFGDLFNAMQEPFQRYLSTLSDNMVRNDESFFSIAIEQLKESRYIADAGTPGIIGRYWSVRNPYNLRPLSYYQSGFLIHLPADKLLLAWFGILNLPGIWMFIICYSIYARVRYLLSVLKHWIKNIEKKI